MARGQGTTETSRRKTPLHAAALRAPELFLMPHEDLPGTKDVRFEAAANQIEALDDLRGRLARYSLIVDLDDTLTVNLALFKRAKFALAQIFMDLAQKDLDPVQLIKDFDTFDLGRVPELGYTPKRWMSSGQMYAATLAGRTLTETESMRVHAASDLAMGVGEYFAGTERTLGLLRNADAHMILLTKGEEAKQTEKITAHGLRRFFGENINIVAHKDASVLKEHAMHLPGEVVVIGDSVSSDIKPARECNLHAVHIDHVHGNWEGDEEHDYDRVPSFANAILELIK